MNDRQRALLLAGYNAAMAQVDEIFSPPARTHNRTPKVECCLLVNAYDIVTRLKTAFVEGVIWKENEEIKEEKK